MAHIIVEQLGSIDDTRSKLSSAVERPASAVPIARAPRPAAPMAMTGKGGGRGVAYPIWTGPNSQVCSYGLCSYGPV